LLNCGKERITREGIDFREASRRTEGHQPEGERGKRGQGESRSVDRQSASLVSEAELNSIALVVDLIKGRRTGIECPTAFSFASSKMPES
jgi:hypothetical protein